jgi:tetratricopeptide (TPR) repeat protein
MESPAIGTEAYDDFPAKRPRKPRDPADAGGATTPDEKNPDAAGADGSTQAAGRSESELSEAPAERKAPPKRERSLPGAADLERHASDAVRRGRGRALRERKPLGSRPQRVQDPAVVLARLVGPDRAKSLSRKLNDAGRAFQAERFSDARTSLRPVVKEAPSLPEGRELMGLTLYRLGRWREAIDQLEIFRELTDSTEQHPVLADCYRALGRVDEVEFLWQELGDASPSGEIVTEGRIVLAGAYADEGDLAKAIRTLQSGWKLPKNPGDQHLRRAYALADFYDRAGKAARARELFKWIAGHEPRFADVTTRVKQLS